MTIQLDHLIVPSRDRRAAAKYLAELLDVPWSENAAVGPFSAVFVNAGLTLDFDERTEPYPIEHYCFRVTDEEFDAIFARIVAHGLTYCSRPFGPHDMQVNTAYGGRLVYWNEPAGHMWEILTVSYAREG